MVLSDCWWNSSLRWPGVISCILYNACGPVCTDALESLMQLRHAGDEQMKHSVSAEHCISQVLYYKPLHVAVV